MLKRRHRGMALTFFSMKHVDRNVIKEFRCDKIRVETDVGPGVEEKSS